MLLKILVFCLLSGAVLPNQIRTQEEIFHQMFIRRRMEQLHAVHNLRLLKNSVKQYKMLTLIAEKIFHIIKICKETLDESEFMPGVSKFPDEGPVREALSNLLENTALFCDILVNMPEPSFSVFGGKPEWRRLLVYGIEFSYKSELLDDLTVQQLGDAALRLSEPYPHELTEPKTEKKKTRKKLKRGPRLSSGSFSGEL